MALGWGFEGSRFKPQQCNLQAIFDPGLLQQKFPA